MKSFIFAFNGIRNLLKHEHNSKIHLAVMICVIVLEILIKIETSEWALIALVGGIIPDILNQYMREPSGNSS